SVLSAAHLMAVGVAGVGPLVCLWMERRERRGDPLASEVRQRLARLSIVALWVGMALGAACLALLWLDPATQFWRAFSVIPARRLWFGLAELAFYLVCMEVYVRRWAGLPRWGHQAMALLAGSNVLYHFPPLFAAVSVISHDSETMLAARTLSWGELVSIFWNPETVSRVAHAILAAAVVTGVAVMGIALSVARTVPAGETIGPSVPTSAGHVSLPLVDGAALATWAARFALAAALFQIPVGVWVLLKLPSSLQDQFLAVDWGATLLFAAALVAMLGLLHHLAAAALGDARGAVWRRCMLLTTALFVLMVGAGHRARAVSATTAARDASNASPVVARTATFSAE